MLSLRDVARTLESKYRRLLRDYDASGLKTITIDNCCCGAGRLRVVEINSHIFDKAIEQQLLSSSESASAASLPVWFDPL